MRRALFPFLLLFLIGPATAQSGTPKAGGVEVMGIAISGNRTTKARIILRELG